MFGFKRKQVVEMKSSAASWVMGMGAASWKMKDYRSYANEGYAINPIVHACVDRIASGIGSVDICVQRKNSDGELEKVDKHPLVDLVSNPNGAQSFKRLLKEMASYYLIGGNAYLLGVGMDSVSKAPPKELMLLPPQMVSIRSGKQLMYPLAYEVRQGQGGTASYNVSQLDGHSAILHSKTFNPLGEHHGMAPLAAAAYGVDIFNQGQAWNKALLDNDARPAGALRVADGDLTDEQYNRIKDQIDSQYSGARNAGRPILLEGGLEWQQLSMSAKDMDHRENMLTNARFIAGVFNVPPQVVNIPGESTFANFEQAIQFLWTDTILPLLRTLLEDINQWLGHVYNDGTYLWYDESMIPALESKRKEKAQALEQASYMTVNEKRAAIGLEAVDGGDTLYVPSNLISLDLAGMTLPEVGSNADNQ